MPSSPPSAEPRAIACLRSGRFRGHGAAEEFARVLPDALPAVGGALFRPRHGRYRRYSAEHLHSRSDSIDKVVLPFIVLVEQQMQLVGWTNGFALFKIASASIKPFVIGSLVA